MNLNTTESALQFLKNTFTTNETHELPEEIEPLQLKIHRNAFRHWMTAEEAKHFCKFINRTSSSGGRRDKNSTYLEKGAVPEDREAKRMRLMTQKGRGKALFSETHLCSRGLKQAVASKKAPIYCGCTVKINATVYENDEDTDIISVVYFSKHVGHSSRSIEDVRNGPSNRIISNFILEQVEKNMTWSNIKSMLRLDKNILIRLLSEGNQDSLPLSFAVKYNDVYYAMSKVLAKRAILDKDFKKSMDLWAKKITSDEVKGFFFSKNLEVYKQGMFMIAFMSEWQLNLLKRDGDIISLDSTHKTCTYQTNKFCYLYTIVARCRDTGKGKPLAWMFTNSESQYPIRYWLEWLKNVHDYQPKSVMIDNSNTEIAAINNTYNKVNASSAVEDEANDVTNGAIRNDSDDETDDDNDDDDNDTNLLVPTEEFNDSVKIYLCNWHIIKSWKANILTKLIPKTSNPKKSVRERKAKRDEALEMLVNLMGAPTRVDFDLRWDDFEMWAAGNEEEWESMQLLHYMEENYYDKKRKWCMAFRKGNYHINTNNYVESWHRHLKEVYLTTMKKQRVDVLIHVLWDLVLSDMMQDHLKILANLRNRVLTKAEKERMEKANAFNEEEAAAMVIALEDGNVRVTSFTKDDTYYDISINGDEMLACSCPDHQSSKACCKHMYLVNRVQGTGLMTKGIHQQSFPESRVDTVAAIDSVTEELTRQESKRAMDETMERLKQAQEVFNSFVDGASRNQFSDLSRPYMNKFITDILDGVNMMKGWQNNPNGTDQHQRRF